MSTDRGGKGPARSRATEAESETDSTRRSWLRRFGVAAVLVGAGVAVHGGGSLPLFGTESRVGVVLVATAALLLGLAFAAGGRVSRGTWWRPDDTEPGTVVPVPGAAYADLTDSQLRTRFRRRAIVAVVDATGCSRSTAEDLVDSGAWTDDKLAAAYLGEGLNPPVLTWLRWRLRGDEMDERAKRRTVAAIRAIRAGSAVPRIEDPNATGRGDGADGTESTADGGPTR